MTNPTLTVPATACAVGATPLQASWTDVAGETYTVEFFDGTTWVAVDSSTPSTATKNGVTPPKTGLKFRIATHKGACTLTASESATFDLKQTPANPALTAPGNLCIATATADQAVTWSPTAGQTYTVDFSSDGSTWTPLTPGAGTATMSAVGPGTGYRFRIATTTTANGCVATPTESSTFAIDERSLPNPLTLASPSHAYSIYSPAHYTTAYPGFLQWDAPAPVPAGGYDVALFTDGSCGTAFGSNPRAEPTTAFRIPAVPAGTHSWTVAVTTHGACAYTNTSCTSYSLEQSGSASAGFATTIPTLAATGIVTLSTGDYVLGGTSADVDFWAAGYTPAGALDTTFNNPTGSIAVDVIPTNTDVAYAMARDTAGNLVLVGETHAAATPGTTSLAVVRLTAAGVPDNAFNGTGIYTLAIPAGAVNKLYAVAINFADDSLFAVGEAPASNGRQGVLIIHLTSAGVLDTGFGDVDGAGPARLGYAITPIGSVDVAAKGVVVQSDGQPVLVAGDGTNILLLRYSTAGIVDATFGAKVAQVSPPSGMTALAPSGIVEVPSGGFVVSASATAASGNNPMYAARVDGTAGQLDNGFNGNGFHVITASHTNEVATSIVLQPDGNIILGGYVQNGPGTADFAAVRLILTSGALDATFGTGGVATSGTAGDDFGRAVGIDVNALIVVAGQSFTVPPGPVPAGAYVVEFLP